MKKSIIIIICILLLAGCGNNEKKEEKNNRTTSSTTSTTTTTSSSTTKTTESFKLSKGEYVNKKSAYKGGYLENIILDSKNRIRHSQCVEMGGCISSIGTYKISNNHLSYKMTDSYHLGLEIDGEKIKNTKTIVCEIIKDNSFKCDNATYTLNS